MCGRQVARWREKQKECIRANKERRPLTLREVALFSVRKPTRRHSHIHTHNHTATDLHSTALGVTETGVEKKNEKAAGVSTPLIQLV